MGGRRMLVKENGTRKYTGRTMKPAREAQCEADFEPNQKSLAMQDF